MNSQNIILTPEEEKKLEEQMKIFVQFDIYTKAIPANKKSVLRRLRSEYIKELVKQRNNKITQ